MHFKHAAVSQTVMANSNGIGTQQRHDIV